MSTRLTALELRGAKEILMTMFVHGKISQSQILKHIKELEKKKEQETGEKTTIASWAQILKVIGKLEALGFVESERGKRNAKICGLTDRAFFYIVLYEHNLYSKNPYGMKRFFQVILPKFGSSLPMDAPVKNFFAQVLEDTQKEVRKRINFEFFDGEYAQWAYTDVLIATLFQGFKNQAGALQKSLPSVFSEIDAHLRHKKSEILPIVKELRDQARKHRQFLEAKEKMFGKFIEVLEHPTTFRMLLDSQTP